MKMNSRFGGQNRTGLALRTKLRVSGYANADAYVKAFHDQYGCSSVNDDCHNNRLDFHRDCAISCSDQLSECMRICNAGDNKILNGWGIYFSQF